MSQQLGLNSQAKPQPSRGPLPMLCTGDIEFLASNSSFAHPGILNNAFEYKQMKEKVAAKAEPWYSTYRKFPGYLGYQPHAKASLHIHGDDRADADRLERGANAAYVSALHYIVTCDPRYAETAKQIINAWGSTLKDATGTSVSLRFGHSFMWMVAGGEILKYTYSGWSTADQERFGKMLRTSVLPRLLRYNPTRSNNWHTLGAQSRMAIAIFLDDRKVFEETVSDTKGLINFYIGNFGNPVPTGFTFET